MAWQLAVEARAQRMRELGATRVVGGVRVTGSTGNLSTGMELQAAVVGDLLWVRGVLDTVSL